MRRVVAFIGGIDITDGRYDSPDFPLFKTIPTLHKGDFYSNCVPGATEQTGPREPWVGAYKINFNLGLNHLLYRRKISVKI